MQPIADLPNERIPVRIVRFRGHSVPIPIGDRQTVCQVRLVLSREVLSEESAEGTVPQVSEIVEQKVTGGLAEWTHRLL